MTWELILQWADYYRSQGSSDDELRTWIAATYPAFAHHLAELPADGGAHGWAQQQQQQQHDSDSMHAEGSAGQTLEGDHSDAQAAVHSAAAAIATAKTSESMPGPGAAGQPEAVNSAEAPRVHRSSGAEVLPLQQIKQHQDEVRSVAAHHSSKTGQTNNTNTIGMVRPPGAVKLCVLLKLTQWWSASLVYAHPLAVCCLGVD